jgi:hypothetical protein
MQPGPKAETPSTALARGTFRGDRHVDRGIVVAKGDPPQVPDPVAVKAETSELLPSLTPQAQIVWNETLPRVMAVGVCEADGSFLARYCSMEALSRETLSLGQPIPASMMTALRQMEEMLGIAGPKSRIGRIQDGKPSNPFDRHR